MTSNIIMSGNASRQDKWQQFSDDELKKIYARQKGVSWLHINCNRKDLEKVLNMLDQQTRHVARQR